MQEPRDDNRVPHPSHGHAAWSTLWPWVDLEDGMCTENGFQLAEHQQDSDVDPTQLEHTAPPSSILQQVFDGLLSRFPNWNYRQVVKSKIHRAIYENDRLTPCVLHRSMLIPKGSSRTLALSKRRMVWMMKFGKH